MITIKTQTHIQHGGIETELIISNGGRYRSVMFYSDDTKKEIINNLRLLVESLENNDKFI